MRSEIVDRVFETTSADAEVSATRNSGAPNVRTTVDGMFRRLFDSQSADTGDTQTDSEDGKIGQPPAKTGDEKTKSPVTSPKVEPDEKSSPASPTKD